MEIFEDIEDNHGQFCMILNILVLKFELVLGGILVVPHKAKPKVLVCEMAMVGLDTARRFSRSCGGERQREL